MADFEAINGVAAGSIEAVNGTAKSGMEAISGLTAPAGASVTEAASLVHWWKLNDSNSTQADSTGSADLTGSSVTLTSSGRGDLSVCEYDRASSSMSTINAGSVTGMMGTPRSYSFWCKFDDTGASPFDGDAPGNYDSPFSCTGELDGYGSLGVDGVCFFYYGGWFKFGVAEGDNDTSKWTTQNTKFAYWGDIDFRVGWHHWVGVIDDGGDVQKLYLDATDSGTTASAIYTPSLDSTTDIEFGLGALHAPGGTPYTNSHCTCQLSDVRVYSIALTSANVTAIYNSGNGDWAG